MWRQKDSKKLIGDNVICLQGLHPSVTEEHIWKELKTVGCVQKLRHIPRGAQSIAFVEFATENDALNAAMRFNQEILCNKRIRVTIEKTPDEMKTRKAYDLKNLPKNTKSERLWQYLTKFGYIFCVTVKYEKGTTNCLGYGFVEVLGDNEFETLIKEGQSIEIPNISILTGEEMTQEEEQPIFLTVEKRDLPQAKPQQSTIDVVDFTDQVYLNWTDVDERKWKDELTAKFNSICDGKVSSVFVTQHGQYQKPHAVVTFQDEDSQQKALERIDALKQFFPNVLAQPDIFKKDLNNQILMARHIKPDLTEADILLAFAADYGDDAIKLVLLKSNQDGIIPKATSPQGFSNTQFATILFKDVQTASKVLASYKTMPNTRNIFVTLTQHSMNILLPQNERAQFKKLKGQGRRARLPENAAKMMQQNEGSTMSFSQLFDNRKCASLPPQASIPPQGMQRFPGAFPNMRGSMPGPGIPSERLPTIGHGSRMSPEKPPLPKGVLSLGGAPKTQETMTLEEIKDDLTAFLGRSEDDKRYILGNLLFPLIQPHCKDPTMPPKVTGMLIDFPVFDVADILELLEAPDILLWRVEEAQELLEEMNLQEQPPLYRSREQPSKAQQATMPNPASKNKGKKGRADDRRYH